MKIEPDELGRKMYSGMLIMLDKTMGKNGLQYGIQIGCRRFSYNLRAYNENDAQCMCEQMNLIYEGEVTHQGSLDEFLGEHE